MRKRVLFILPLALLIFLGASSTVRAIDYPSSCISGYQYYVYQAPNIRHDMCCPNTTTIPGGKVTHDGNCYAPMAITVPFNEGTYGPTCVYKVSLSELELMPVGSGLECNNSDGLFHYTISLDPQCGSSQCKWGDYCYASREEGCNSVFWGFGSLRCVIGFRTGFLCCLGADAGECSTTPWCETSCPTGTPPPNGGNGGSGGGTGLDPIELSDAEKCEGDPESGSCTSCYGSGGVWTELGCIKATQYGVTVAVMRIFVGIVTGIAVVRFIQAGFMLNTDDPEQIKEGKSIAVSAIMALIFGGMIPLILHFLGVDVLGLGELGSFF